MVGQVDIGGNGLQELYEWTFSDVSVDEFSISGASGDDQIQNSFSLGFSKVDFDYLCGLGLGVPIFDAAMFLIL